MSREFLGLLVIIIINVEYCDENKDLAHMPLRIAAKDTQIASIVKSSSGQMTFFAVLMILQ